MTLKRISLQSRVLTLVGSALYGPPAKHGLPSDFFHLIEDREIRDMQTNVHANLTRARLIRAERWMARGLALVLAGVWLSVISHKFI